MKKFMKGCGITALVLLILGLIMAVVAGTLQGRTAIEDVVESVTGGRVKVNLGSLDEWGVTIGDNAYNASWEEWGDNMKYDIGKDIGFDKSFEIFKGDMAKTLLGNDVKSLDIEAGGCLFTIEESEDDNFYMAGENIGKAQGFVKNQTLYVKAYKTGKVSLNDIKACRIILYVPAGSSFDKAEIEIGAGQLQFADIQAKELIVEVGAGEILFSDIVADRIAGSVGMGRISLDGIQAGSMDAEVGMGSLEVRGNLTGNAELECSMGNIEMTLSGKEEDFNYYLEGAMGNVSIGGDNYSGLAQERTILNNAEKDIRLECAMGNISIGFTR